MSNFGIKTRFAGNDGICCVYFLIPNAFFRSAENSQNCKEPYKLIHY